jgi:hypothetical protein
MTASSEAEFNDLTPLAAPELFFSTIFALTPVTAP